MVWTFESGCWNLDQAEHEAKIGALVLIEAIWIWLLFDYDEPFIPFSQREGFNGCNT